jgi:hypothetical protein
MECGAPKTNGMPCKRQVAPGFTRCNLHGGANPAAKIKAEQMLAQARLPACEALYDIIEGWQRDRCAVCGYPSNDTDMLKTIIRAAQVILDRSGLGPRATLEVAKQTDGDLNLDLLTDEELAEMDGLLAQMKHLKDRIHARLHAAQGLPLPSLPPQTM